jgi:hypothetical protein
MFDVYIGGSLWQTFDGFSETPDERTVNLDSSSFLQQVCAQCLIPCNEVLIAIVCQWHFKLAVDELLDGCHRETSLEIRLDLLCCTDRDKPAVIKSRGRRFWV